MSMFIHVCRAGDEPCAPCGLWNAPLLLQGESQMHPNAPQLPPALHPRAKHGSVPSQETALSSRHLTLLSSKEPHQLWDGDLFFCSTFWAQSTSWALGEQRGKGQANCFNPRWRPGQLTKILVWRCKRQLMTHATKTQEREPCKF